MTLTHMQVRKLASDPHTPPEQLRQFATNADWKVRQQVAANPNTPTDVLLELGSDFPEQLINNPIFPLWFLENPNFINEIPKKNLLSLFKLQTIPEYLQKLVIKSGNLSVQYVLVRNPQTPACILEHIAQHDNASLNMLLASNPNTPTYILEKLVDYEHAGIRSEMARNPNAPASILAKLAQDRYLLTRLNVAKNPSTPTYILAELVQQEQQHNKFAIRFGIELLQVVARHRNTSIETLNILAGDSDASV